MSLHLHLGRGVHTVEPACSLAHVARCMRDYHLDGILVTDSAISKTLGVITLDDLLDAMAHGCDPRTTKVEELLPAEVPRLPAKTFTASDVQRLRKEGWRHLALVDEKERPVGLVSLESVTEESVRKAA